MLNYINKDIARLQHSPPIKPQHSPHHYNAPVYGQKYKFFMTTITNKKLTPDQINHCQEFCGYRQTSLQ